MVGSVHLARKDGWKQGLWGTTKNDDYDVMCMAYKYKYNSSINSSYPY